MNCPHLVGESCRVIEAATGLPLSACRVSRLACADCAAHGRPHDVTGSNQTTVGLALAAIRRFGDDSDEPLRYELGAPLHDRPREAPQSGVVKLNADAHGFGDAAFTAWISEGSKAGPVQLVHHATGAKADFLRMLGQWVTSDPTGAVTTFDAYRHEYLIEYGRVPRVVSRGRYLGITTPPRRPGPIRIRPDAFDYARQVREDALSHGATAFVLLLPQTVHRPREWPANNWIDLAWQLRDRGVEPLMKLAKDCPGDCAEPRADCPHAGHLPERWHRFWRAPRTLADDDWHRTAALMLLADLVVGVSSGAVSLAACLDVPTLVLEGPTAASPLWSHAESVEVLSVDRRTVDCVGCYFAASRGYRLACEQGCAALSALTPAVVLGRILSKLGELQSAREGNLNDHNRGLAAAKAHAASR